LMEFGLVPLWDKTKLKRFHNARVETVDEKPSFKKDFIQRHCLIPMNGFYEYIWTSDKENWLACFTLPSDEPLLAAAIYSSNNTFSILTMPPSKLLLDTGHDRSPLFLKADEAFSWLDLENEEPEELKNFLRKGFFHPEFTVEKAEKPQRKKKTISEG
jgi:putative SOS response-associated peptidase YedK